VEVSQESGTVNLGGIDQPVIGQRRLELDLRMRDGEINMIGGLIQNEEDKSISGVPGVGNIPIIGNLFKSTNLTKTQDELLIVMVPHIIRSPDITDEDLRPVATGNEQSVKLTYAPKKVQPSITRPQGMAAPAQGTVPAMTPTAAPPAAPPASAPPATAPPTPIPQAALVQPPVPQPGVPQPGVPQLSTLRAAAPPGAPTATGPLAVTFTPSQTEVAAGGTVPVTVQVNNVNDLAAVQMALKFDPKILHINNLTSGDLIKRNGPELVPSRNVLNDSGDATIGIARNPTSGGVSGSGGLLTIVFQAIAKGTTTITVPQFTMTGSSGQSIPAAAPTLTINVK
jgi:general secretion pathway protein D